MKEAADPNRLQNITVNIILYGIIIFSIIFLPRKKVEEIPPSFLQNTPIAKVAYQAWNSKKHEIMFVKNGYEFKITAMGAGNGTLMTVARLIDSPLDECVFFADTGVDSTLQDFAVKRKNEALYTILEENNGNRKERAFYLSIYNSMIREYANSLKSQPQKN